MPGRTAFIYFILFKKTPSRSLHQHQHLGHLIVYMTMPFSFCWLGLHNFALLLGYADTLFLPGKEGSLREIVNSMESLRQFCLSEAQLCSASPLSLSDIFLTLLSVTSPLCCAASGGAFLWSRLQSACCVCCRSVVLLGAYANAIIGASSSCREMVQCCLGCLFAARRACFTCSDILPLVQTFRLRPPEFIML